VLLNFFQCKNRKIGRCDKKGETVDFLSRFQIVKDNTGVARASSLSRYRRILDFVIATVTKKYTAAQADSNPEK
jgi:hypothetical protein